MTYAQQIKLQKLRDEVKKAYREWQSNIGNKQAAKWIAANAKLDKHLAQID